ncbi:MAG: BMP family ABC transporter substrate-binding protein [Ruminococcus sp.]|nr:BMP family ABC transporter substrate-binding protein [Ruminococcus sp.]
MSKKYDLRLFSLAAAGALAFSGLTSCGSDSGADASGSNNGETSVTADTGTVPETGEAAPAVTEQVVPESPTANIKLGLICMHDESSTYDLNFINSVELARKTLGLTKEQIVVKTNVPEAEECKQVAEDLAGDGCNIVFADSFGHEKYMLEAAAEFPDVQFCHATGTLAHTEKRDNFHNAFASIYEGRYLVGVAAGMKINEMIQSGRITEDQAVMGYIGAFTYAEVISGYTAFYLGAKSVCPSVTMKVTFTGSWFDIEAEKSAAEQLIADGCVLISQHADSMGAPTACEEAGVPNISYNGSTKEECPNTFIVSSRINWAPYFVYMINSVVHDDPLDSDWVGSVYTDSVQLTAINNDVAAAGTHDALDEVRKELEEGTLHIFDTSKFTVDGKHLDTYMADVDTDPDYTPDTEVVGDGYFHESEKRSAPYFDLRIDGITLINEKY